MPNSSIKGINKTGLLFILLIFLGACQKKDKLGISIQPQGDRFAIHTLDTFSIRASTVFLDSVRSDENTYTPLGALADPLLGNSFVDLYTQILLPEDNLTFGSSVKFDSAVLTFKYAAEPNLYGAAGDLLRFEIDELAQSITLDNSYYSNINLPTSTRLGDATLPINLKDSIIIKLGSQTFSYPPHLRIPLSNAFTQKLNSASTSDLANNDNFLNYFKGIRVKSSVVSGVGTILNVEQRSILSGITVYYNDSLKKDFPFGKPSKEVPRVAGYRHQHSTLVQQAVTHLNPADSAFIKGMGGLAAKLDISGLTALSQVSQDGEMVIHGAELRIVPLMGTVTSALGLPNQLLLLVKDSASGQFKAVADRFYTQNPNYHGGTWDASCGCYRFNIVRQIQQTISEYKKSGKNLSPSFYVIIPTDNPFYGSRLILNTAALSGMKLSVLYSVVK